MTARFTLRFSELVQGLTIAYWRPLLVLTPLLAASTGLATSSAMAGVLTLLTFPVFAIAVTAGATWWTHHALRQPAVLTFAADGVASGDPPKDRTLPWSEVRDAHFRAALYVLVLHRRGQVIVPQRAFASAADEDAFRALLATTVEPPSLR